MIKVKATNEGLIGKETASGYIIDTVVPFVSLPCEAALGKFIWIYNPANGRSTSAIVLDVGPWYTDDENYVLLGARPRAETDASSNGSGIDLGSAVWATLGMADNTDVVWEFLPGTVFTQWN